ncbi:YceD family protein [Pinisolibacter sp.]|uniref:YceD family protein n=1 Tax=Pinisolibacter sp. TaxID=2172024 RepID=UPI002FDCA1EE
MTDTEHPIRRTLSPAEVPHTGTHVIIEADAGQRAALAEAAGIVSVEALSAEVLVRPWSGEGFAVTGKVSAKLTQTCVVTLEPVATTVDEAIDVKLVPPEEMAKYEVAPDENGEIDLDAAALDIPDPIEGGVIDVGAIVTEHFMLGLDPYPRKPGVVFDAETAGAGDGREKLSPFAALARLKKE